MGNASSAGLPYVAGEEDGDWARSTSQGHWHLHSGTKKSNGNPVSIFRMDKKAANSESVEAGRRGFQRIRTLRHPYILPYVDGAEMETELVLVTEHVVPLRSYLQKKYTSTEGWSGAHRDAEIAWGAYCISCALKFLHDDCKLAHCNISWDTIFVTEVGDWNLGGMDLLGPRETLSSILFSSGRIQPFQFQSPERRASGMTQLFTGDCPLHAQDMWALGEVIREAYNKNPPTNVTKYTGMLQHGTAKRRPTAVQMLRSAFLKCSSVQQRIFLAEQWNVQPIDKKVEWLRKWSSECTGPAGDDPLAEKIGVVLGHDLEQAISRDASARENKCPPPTHTSSHTAIAEQPPNLRAVVSFALPPLLDISKRWPADVRASRVGPLLVSLLLMNDRGVRVLLLSQVEVISPALDEDTINKKIFQPLCAGFSDASPQLRELTLKSMVVFVDHLSDSNMNDKLLRHLTRLQSDPEDSIRTNVIIFLGKMAGKLKMSAKKKILLPAFARGIKDRFPSARLAGLRAVTACSSYFSPEEVCIKVLPAVIPCTIDPSSALVRDAAFSCLDLHLSKLRDVSQKLKLKEEEEAAAAAEAEASITAASGQSSVQKNIDKGVFSRMGMGGETVTNKSKNSNTWGAWALSKISDQLVNSTIGISTVQKRGGEMSVSPYSSAANSLNTSGNPSPSLMSSGFPLLPEHEHLPLPARAAVNTTKESDSSSSPDGWDDADLLMYDIVENDEKIPILNKNKDLNTRATRQSNISPQGPPRPAEKTSFFNEAASEPSRAEKRSMKLKGKAKKVEKHSVGDGWEDF